MTNLNTCRPRNLLTFDTEEWFHANYDQVDLAVSRGKGSRFVRQVESLLQLCRETNCKATFFVLGCVAEDYPEVVRSIVRQGHEIASHGYSHELAYKQTIDEFAADVKTSITILEDVCGCKVLGYRAPSWSIVERNLHYLSVLETLGLQYDASIFPVKTFLYGIPNAPTSIHKPVICGRQLDLYEVPMSVMRLAGRSFGYSGGFYFRFFPALVIKYAIEAANRTGDPAIVYLHPREIDPDEQRLELPLLESFIHYHNIAGTQAKLETILHNFSFTSISEHLRLLQA